ncbi:hypothetical protein E2C01_084403 [Portunus trituberculatus]|uniref:Uncharacterized protein n=1 Tax=Portunus trituberculatus TaxID=210409 RepID=A0A5B7J3Z1_PORTR|nr:hypothetical protein [Portunus trituberculatus]
MTVVVVVCERDLERDLCFFFFDDRRDRYESSLLMERYGREKRGIDQFRYRYSFTGNTRR